MKLFSSLINTCLFVGLSPLVPGTVGSIFALFLWWFFQPSFTIFITIIIIISLLSYFTILFELTNTNKKDPQHIVVDEAIGMWISVLFLSANDYLHIIFAFILFRLFDILKPSIINRVQNIKGPVGILFDDIIAGLMTCMIIAGISTI